MIISGILYEPNSQEGPSVKIVCEVTKKGETNTSTKCFGENVCENVKLQNLHAPLTVL